MDAQVRTHSRTFSVLVAASAIVLAMLFAAAVCAPIARAAAPESQYYFESDSGNPIGNGHSGYAATPSTVFERTVWGAEFSAPTGSWRIGAADVGGAELVAGTTYDDTVAWAWDAAQPYLEASWHNGGYAGTCDYQKITGSFTVHDVAYRTGKVDRLSMSFDIDCVGRTGTLHGELRYKTSAPAFVGVTQTPLRNSQDVFAHTPIGQVSAKDVLTLTNVGNSSASIGTATLAGDDPGQFEVVDDACSGSTLAAGASCTYGVRFKPTRNGESTATVSIDVGTTHGLRRVELTGTGVSATSTTITAPSGWQSAHPIIITGQTTPSPTSNDGGASLWFVSPDGSMPDDVSPMMADGTATYSHTLPPGEHRLYAEFRVNANSVWEGSRSETVTVKVTQPTTIALGSSANPAYGDGPPTITATVNPKSATFTAGRLVLEDVTTGRELARIDVTPAHKTIRIEPALTAGQHLLRATYDGYEGVVGSSAELTQTMRMHVGAEFSPRKFYPYPDGYLDKLTVEAWRATNLEVDIEINPAGTTTPVRTHNIRADDTWFVWKWDGRNDAGALVPTGDYNVRFIFSDGGTAPTVVKQKIRVSRDKVKWRTKSITLRGNKYVLTAKSKNGSISRSRSIYSGGVRLNSGKGSAVVGYAIPVVKADVYGSMTFGVYGKSTNKHKALIAVWHPHAGYYKDVGNYDSAKLVGPGAKLWKTKLDGSQRVKKGKVRTIVTVAKGMGRTGPANFHVKNVKLTYKAGTIIKVSGASVSALEEGASAAPYEQAGSSASALLGPRAPSWLDVRTGKPKLPPADSATDLTPEPTDDPDVAGEPAASAEPDPSEDPSATEEPAPTAEPEASADPFPTSEPEPTQAPEASPTPEPTSAAEPDPTEAPAPDPTEAPQPEPTKTPAPEPEATPPPTAEPSPPEPELVDPTDGPATESGDSSDD